LTVLRGCTAENLVASANLPVGKVADALQLLAGTGVIRQLDEEHYEIGARLFEKWVLQQ
jgi:DNA-binding IclR family transcriptional regulator